MAKLSEKGPFRPTPGTASTVSATGYITAFKSRGKATTWNDGALRPTAPDQQTGQVYNNQSQGTGRIKNT